MKKPVGQKQGIRNFVLNIQETMLKLKTGDKVMNGRYKGIILSTKHDPIYLVSFPKMRALSIHKGELTKAKS